LGVVSGSCNTVRWPDGDWWGDSGVGIEMGWDAERVWGEDGWSAGMNCVLGWLRW